MGCRLLPSRTRMATCVLVVMMLLYVILMQHGIFHIEQAPMDAATGHRPAVDHDVPQQQQQHQQLHKNAGEVVATVVERPGRLDIEAQTEGAPRDVEDHQARRGASTAIPNVQCTSGRLIDFPMTGLEQELKRLSILTETVMREVNAVFWPTDGTLLGLMRTGRVSTDRDLDYQIHSTYDTCFQLLSSLKPVFEKHARIKSFKVVKVKWNGRKIGRYVMVRLFREFGTFDTGPDFNCVYLDDPQAPKYFTHRGVLTLVPAAVYPLGWCLMYGRAVPCPNDGMSVLESLKPRYEGCMVFPHCLGDPLHSSRRCMSPHPDFPLADFVSSTKALASCGFTSLEKHYRTEPSCAEIVAKDEKRCETISGTRICFLQKFDG